MKRQPYDRGYEKTAYLYDLFDLKENIEFFYHYASHAGEILDIGAGTGRIAIPIAERGVAVTCVVPSPAMRREFARRISQLPKLKDMIALVNGDGASFNIGRTFTTAILSGSFDHFLDDAERRASLFNIGKHLKPHGLLVFDVFLGLMEASPLTPAGSVQLDDKEIRRFVAGRLLPGKIKETQLVFEIYQHGVLTERIEERGLVGIVDREELHTLLQEAGFDVRFEFGDYQFTKFGEGDRLLVIEAVKRD